MWKRNRFWWDWLFQENINSLGYFDLLQIQRESRLWRDHCATTRKLTLRTEETTINRDYTACKWFGQGERLINATYIKHTGWIFGFLLLLSKEVQRCFFEETTTLFTQGNWHPRPQGYPGFLNVVTCPIFPLTIWIVGSGDEGGELITKGKRTTTDHLISGVFRSQKGGLRWANFVRLRENYVRCNFAISSSLLSRTQLFSLLFSLCCYCFVSHLLTRYLDLFFVFLESSREQDLLDEL